MSRPLPRPRAFSRFPDVGPLPAHGLHAFRTISLSPCPSPLAGEGMVSRPPGGLRGIGAFKPCH
jgi:hypothetical protein